MSHPQISIIVPAYNAEAHIPALVENVRKQTFEDWELILVNDGSSDATGEVCELFVHKDARIHVIDQENQGPSAARNRGIKEAKGDWITFVDADDALLDNFLLSMMTLAKQGKDVDIVHAGYIIVERSGNDVYTYDTTVYEGNVEVRNALANTRILHRCCPWGKLFRRSIMIENDIRFDTQLRHSEDRLFVYNYLQHTRGIATTSTIGYLYDSTSITSLKNKHLDIDMLYYRQQKLQEAAHQIIERFGMNGEECFMFAKHLFGLLATSIQSLYEDTGNTKLTISNQQKFYEIFFDESLYSEVKDTNKWKQFAKGNTLLDWAINQQFCKLNNHLKTIDRKIAISNLIAKIIKRQSTQREFTKVINVMNQ